jgi:hypothetical protein
METRHPWRCPAHVAHLHASSPAKNAPRSAATRATRSPDAPARPRYAQRLAGRKRPLRAGASTRHGARLRRSCPPCLLRVRLSPRALIAGEELDDALGLRTRGGAHVWAASPRRRGSAGSARGTSILPCRAAVRPAHHAGRAARGPGRRIRRDGARPSSSGNERGVDVRLRPRALAGPACMVNFSREELGRHLPAHALPPRARSRPPPRC